MEAVERTRARLQGGAVIAAKAWFFATGFVVNTSLPVLIGQTQYGLFRRAIGVSAIVTGLLTAATAQAVSRRIAATSELDRPATVAALVRLHARVGVACAAVVLIAAPLVAAHQHTPALAPLIAILSIIAIAYSVFAARVGALNGARRLTTQAGLDAALSTIRSVAIVGGALALPLIAGDRLHESAAFGAACGATFGAIAI
ncbi:MAG: hypothetical protein ACHREM_31125, partial [Polyangiales bacterium]